MYADNCPGQNKNQTVVGYLCYLVQIMKRYPEIRLNLMLVGHTKFSPDRHFGTIKKRGKQFGIRRILDLVGDDGIVKRSAINNDVITCKDPGTGIKNLDWFDWNSFLAQRFGKCIGIREWRLIRIMKDTNFIQVAKEISEVFITYENNNNEVILTTPNIIQPEGLSNARIDQLKLFTEYVHDHHKDFLVKNY